MSSEAVKVLVRARPLNSKEKREEDYNALEIDMEACQVSLSNRGDAVKRFTFDAVYDGSINSNEIYEETGFPLVESVMDGYNGTIFAYGQTGCGKTFTMEGLREPKDKRGIILQAFDHVFDRIHIADKNIKFLVHASYLEIYNEDIKDLLNPGGEKLDLHEHPSKGVYVHGLSHHVVNNASETDKIMQKGGRMRHTGATLMNDQSSRSHSIFTIVVESEKVEEQQGDDGKSKGTRTTRKVAKLNLVDLAGSERQSKTGAAGQRLKEATKINLSLSALGNVISALVDGKSKHIPYRDSKLTRLLQDSLGGNMKTIMIACISPSSSNTDETMSTLRYANRAKEIKNKPKQNMDAKDALIAKYQEEIKRLKALLEGKDPSLLAAFLQGGLKPAPKQKVKKITVDPETGEQTETEVEVEVEDEFEGGGMLTAMENDLRAQFEAMQLQNKKLLEDKSNIEKNAEEIKALMEQEKEKWLKEKLTLLESDVVMGGEEADDQNKVTAFEQRQQKIFAKIKNRKERMKELLKDEENFEEAMYTNLSEQVEDKNRKIRKLKQQMENMQKELEEAKVAAKDGVTKVKEQLHQSEKERLFLLAFADTAANLVRKDCNFSSLDRIRKQSTFDKEGKVWTLPKVTLEGAGLPGSSSAKPVSRRGPLARSQQQEEPSSTTSYNLIKSRSGSKSSAVIGKKTITTKEGYDYEDDFEDSDNEGEEEPPIPKNIPRNLAPIGALSSSKSSFPKAKGLLKRRGTNIF
eukprot:Nk52_evm27s156 gene=Nk52_evmTU27s156